MRRRELIAASVGVLSAGKFGAAVAAPVWRVGQVFSGTAGPLADELGQGLRDLGYVDGASISLKTRFVAPRFDDVRKAILEILPEIDLLVVWGTIGGAAAKSAAPKVPVVFISVGAPVEIGLVETLSRPGGNMTGISFEATSETYAKRLQLLKEVLPSLSRVALLGAKGDPNVPFAMTSLNSPALNVSATLVEIASSDDLPPAFNEMRQKRQEALIVIAGALTLNLRKPIADLALANRLPSCHGFDRAVVEGGLMSLGPDLNALARQGARLVAKIVSGTKPSEIPVEQPARYTMSINLRTAGALGLTIPPSVLARADEVIE